MNSDNGLKEITHYLLGMREGLTIFEVIRPVYGNKKSSNSKPSKNLVNKQTQSDEPVPESLGTEVWFCQKARWFQSASKKHIRLVIALEIDAESLAWGDHR